MPARFGPGFEFEEDFRDFCHSHGVKAAAGTYRSCMNLISAHLGVRLGPAMLRSENDVESLVPRLSLTAFNRFHRANFKSVMRKYVQMVRTNFNGRFGAFASPAIDVDPATLPQRIRLQVSRVIRDTSLARELKRAYACQCQLCGGKLALGNEEYYVEAHHLRPLGQPHNGPDTRENIICVCPNCHVLLDYGVRSIGPKTVKIRRHEIGQEFIDYHNARCR